MDRALKKVARQGGEVVLIDGTLIPTQRRTRRANRRNHSGKHHHHGLQFLVLTDEKGHLIWISAARPGRMPWGRDGRLGQWSCRAAVMSWVWHGQESRTCGGWRWRWRCSRGGRRGVPAFGATTRIAQSRRSCARPAGASDPRQPVRKVSGAEPLELLCTRHPVSLAHPTLVEILLSPAGAAGALLHPSELPPGLRSLRSHRLYAQVREVNQ
ncbi:transposase family protein [Streptomyces sp. 3330]|uniref:transposase family protein n=1 Tax=Streptomyces sp. 3330 TaxID=2817755 RepID=UPI00286A3090|nr:transposase family protein [Streptomyces sp. 3330]